MRVLVTGGAGFIGSHLVDRLLDDGHRVTVIDDFSTGKTANLVHAEAAGARLHVVHTDLTAPAVHAAVVAAAPEVAFHLAAQVDVRRSVADPVHDAMVNVVGTVRLLEGLRAAGSGKLVFTTSGGCIYGEPSRDELPVDEAFDGHPHSPYGASKRGTEEYLHAYASLYGLRWTSLALANVYGPRQDPGGEAGVVSIFAGLMLAGQPVTVYGDGEQTRDFVAVSDVVEAFVAAADAADGLRCNIGTGRETSVNELFDAVADATGYDGRPQYAPARTGELAHIALDCSRARDRLGWAPTTDLAAGVGRTVDWVRTPAPGA